MQHNHNLQKQWLKSNVRNGILKDHVCLQDFPMLLCASHQSLVPTQSHINYNVDTGLDQLLPSGVLGMLPK